MGRRGNLILTITVVRSWPCYLTKEWSFDTILDNCIHRTELQEYGCLFLYIVMYRLNLSCSQCYILTLHVISGYCFSSIIEKHFLSFLTHADSKFKYKFILLRLTEHQKTSFFWKHFNVFFVLSQTVIMYETTFWAFTQCFIPWLRYYK